MYINNRFKLLGVVMVCFFQHSDSMCQNCFYAIGSQALLEARSKWRQQNINLGVESINIVQMMNSQSCIFFRKSNHFILHLSKSSVDLLIDIGQTPNFAQFECDLSQGIKSRASTLDAVYMETDGRVLRAALDQSHGRPHSQAIQLHASYI